MHHHFRAFEAFVIIMATTLLAFFCCMFLSTCVPDQTLQTSGAVSLGTMSACGCGVREEVLDRERGGGGREKGNYMTDLFFHFRMKELVTLSTCKTAPYRNIFVLPLLTMAPKSITTT